MLNDYSYKNDNDCDVVHIIFSIIGNLTELYMDNINEVFDEIKKMNKLIESSNLDDEKKKSEKKFLINVIKDINERIKNIKDNKTGNKKKENDNIIESKKIGNKDSTRIQLKKLDQDQKIQKKKLELKNLLKKVKEIVKMGKKKKKKEVKLKMKKIKVMEKKMKKRKIRKIKGMMMKKEIKLFFFYYY